MQISMQFFGKKLQFREKSAFFRVGCCVYGFFVLPLHRETKTNKTTMSKKVAIQLSKERLTFVSDNRFLNDIDSHWYETTKTAIYKFNEDDIEQIKIWLTQHYVLAAAFIWENGHKEIWEKFQPKPEYKVDDINLVCDLSALSGLL